MPIEAELPDGRVLEFPDGTNPAVIQATVKKVLGVVPQTTVLGQVKEGFKGLIPGAVGLVESAATGASALLPEDYEKAAREKIASVAGAAKAPFAAAPGYEETVGRKLGEAIGSTVPFLAAGPLGLAGRVGAVGLGVGAGAGEARTRAEKEGATAEQRSTATALGVIPGAMEVFAPFRILSRVPEAATAQGVQLVKRALVAGGEEAAQEAASGFAQNLIAKGVYKPEQELIEGLGEQAAYGGATGAIVQGLMDLALGRRARGAQPAPGTLPGEAPVERAERLAAEVAAAKAAQQPAPPSVPTTPPAPPVAEIPTPPTEAPVAPPVEAPTPPAPPVAETPAPPPIEEPKVRKPGEPPAGGMQPAEIEGLGISKKQPIYRRMLGKDLENPEQRAAVLADIENYLTRGNGSEESRTKLAEFKAKFAPAPAPPPVAETPAPVAPPVAETPSVPSVPTEPETGGAGAPVVSEPGAGAAPEGVGAVEPTGVVRPVTDVEQPVGGEGAAPVAVAPAAPAPAPEIPKPAAPALKPAPLPEFTEADIDRAVDTGLLTEEQAEVYRAELREEEAPPTAMGAAFQKQVDAIKAQMDALKRNKRRPAKKTPAGDKYDELEAQLESLQVKETGDLATKLEKMGASGVVGTRGERPVIDLDAVQENLIKARAAPKMYQAVLNYIGVDKDGNYLPTTYSREEAAEMAGLGRGSGANVTRVAQAMGITADVVSRFHAGQTDILVLGKNVSESGTGLTDVGPTRGVLYEPPKKPLPVEQQRAIAEKLKGEKFSGKEREKLQKQLNDAKPRVAAFARGAVTEDGKLDFTGLTDKQIAEIYARASNYDPKRGKNAEVMGQLRQLIDTRTKADRKGMQSALERAYRVVRVEEEAAAEQEGIEPETVAPDQRVSEKEAFEEPEVVDKTRRLSDEDTDYQQARTGPVDLENSREMDAALRGKSFTESIDYAIKNARDDLDRQILVKVKRRAEELANKGVQFSFALTAPGRVLRGALGLATTTSAGLGDATTVDVKLNGFTNDPSDTLSQETLVHELIHAVTVAQITYAPQGTAAIKLRALQQELVGIFNQRYKAGTLTATEKGVVNNALENAKELLAYGLTNGDVQNWLASIPDPSGGTFLSRMFNIVSQVLGLKGKENSALARLMAVSEEILDESLASYVAEANKRGLSFGKQANTTGIPSWVLKEAQGLKTVWHKGPIALYEAKSVADKTIYIAAKQGQGRTKVDIRSYTGSGFTPAELAELRQAADNLTPQASPRLSAQTEAAVQGVDVIGEQEAAKPMSGNPALKARINLANNMGGLMNEFTKWYGGDIRTAMGRLNPMTLISRALDSDRISAEAQLIGGLKKLDGLIVATELTDANGDPMLGADGKPLSYKNVVARIADAAKKAKKPFAEYLKSVDTALYGHREYNVRKNNELLEQQAQALEAAGKKPEADKLREEIATLAIKDPKKLDALEAAFQQDDFIKGISADLDAIRFNFIDMLVETGRISKEAAQEWKDNEGYIPFKRVQDYTDAFDDAGSSRRGVGATRNIKKFKGSTRQSTSVVENFSSLLNWATGEAMRNDARNRALEDMVIMGAAKRGSAPAPDSPGGVQQTYENGERKEYYVPDPMLMVGFGMQPYEMGRLTKALNKYGTRVLRAGVTTMPPFAIKQVFDDISRAYAYAGVKNNAALTKNILFNFPKNWANEIFKTELFKTTKGQVNVKDLRKLGIVATFDLSREGNIKDVMVEAGAKKEGLFNTILRVMEAGAKASDLSVRQAIYSQVLKETGDTAKAESAAREIINFSYQGAMKEVRFVASVVPFFNAYAQGMDKLATAAAGKVVGQTTGVARSMFYTRMTYLTAMGLAYALMMQDDEEYNKLPDHVRDTHWILPGVKIDGKPVGIPLAPDLGFFFKAIPERVVRYLKYQGTDEERAAIEVASELFVRGYDVFSPPNVTPQLIRPVLENLVNYSFFLGRPLESQAQLQLRPFQRYGVGTSDAMKTVAEWLESSANATGVDAFAVSPIKLENAVRGLLGTTGGLALSMADMVINPDRTDRPLHQQLSAQLTGASAVLKNPVGTKYMDEIYNLEKKSEQVYNTYKNQLKTDPNKADKFLENNLGMYEIRPAVQAVMKQIRALNKIAMDIDKDTSMSPEERRKEIDELRVEQNEIARVVFSLRKEARDIQMGL